MLKGSFSKEFIITLNSVLDYSDISGDKNPIHLDKAYASKSFFGRRVVHGGLLIGYISSIIGNDFPGNGAVLLNQEIKYLNPTFLNDKIKITVKIIETIPDKNLYHLSTNCYKESGKKVIEGKALVKLF